MKYQSPWWKCVAALLALCVGIKLISCMNVPEKIKLWTQGAWESDASGSEAAPSDAAAEYDDSWLAAESAIPASAFSAQEEFPLADGEILYKKQEKKPLNVNNLSTVQLDYQALLEEGWSYSLTPQKPQILIDRKSVV